MPVFEYKCTSCKSTYDIYHKVREIKEDVICPSCGSNEHTRMLSATQISMVSASGSSYAPASSCETGGCCGGACSVN
ncbi:MAG: hypothetical protein EPO24_14330 [Bacteroidetes bacterium]|nr:MAG: hypothetical protein EPO24_14330 [Bacteroidota bacterium]